jgi:protein translocase SecG subunit
MMAAILLQQRGSGIGSTFGGGGHLYSVRRGAEKVLFIATIILAVVFFASAIALVLLGR